MHYYDINYAIRIQNTEMPFRGYTSAANEAEPQLLKMIACVLFRTHSGLAPISYLWYGVNYSIVNSTHASEIYVHESNRNIYYYCNNIITQLNYYIIQPNYSIINSRMHPKYMFMNLIEIYIANFL